MAIDLGLLFIGSLLALGKEGEEYIPENYERDGVPLAGGSDNQNAADEEDVLHAVSLPRKVFEVELK